MSSSAFKSSNTPCSAGPLGFQNRKSLNTLNEDLASVSLATLFSAAVANRLQVLAEPSLKAHWGLLGYFGHSQRNADFSYFGHDDFFLILFAKIAAQSAICLEEGCAANI